MAKFGELFITEKIPICHLEAPHLEASQLLVSGGKNHRGNGASHPDAPGAE
jgi:hypothetical protein